MGSDVVEEAWAALGRASLRFYAAGTAARAQHGRPSDHGGHVGS